MEMLGQVASKGASAASAASSAATSAAAGVAAAVGGVRDRTSDAVTRARHAYDGHSYSELRTYLAEFFKDRVDLQDLREAGYGHRGAVLRGARMEALERLFSLSRPIRARVLLALRETIKDAALSDPDMWESARWRLESVIDLFWDDLTVYVESVVGDAKDQMLNRAADHSALQTLGHQPTCLTPTWLRANLLYHYLPFDRSVFGQVRDPAFWILTAISITPMFGIRVAFFSIVLLCIVLGSPPDEYQTVTFILTFKGAQFLSSGVFMACVAAVKYYMCVQPGGLHTCDTEGPGVSQDLVTSSVDFVGSCALVWIAFLLLPCTRSFAGVRDITEEKKEAPEDARCCQYDSSRGGRLAGLLGYDLLSFLLSCLLIYSLTVVDVSKADQVRLEQVAINKDLLVSDLQHWQFRSRFFFGRILYGLLSFPFLVFQLPILNGILTHTNPTGYNPQGLCVPYLLRPMEESKAQ